MQFLQALPTASTDAKPAQAKSNVEGPTAVVSPAEAPYKAENFSDVFEKIVKKAIDADAPDQVESTTSETAEKALVAPTEITPTPKHTSGKIEAIVDEAPQDYTTLENAKDPHQLRDQTHIEKSTKKPKRTTPVLEGIILPSMSQASDKVIKSAAASVNTFEVGNQRQQIEKATGPAVADTHQRGYETSAEPLHNVGKQVRRDTSTLETIQVLNAVRPHQTGLPNQQPVRADSNPETPLVTTSTTTSNHVTKDQVDRLIRPRRDAETAQASIPEKQATTIPEKQAATTPEKQADTIGSRHIARLDEAKLSAIERPAFPESAVGKNTSASGPAAVIAEGQPQKAGLSNGTRRQETGQEAFLAERQVPRPVPEQAVVRTTQLNSFVPAQQVSAATNDLSMLVQQPLAQKPSVIENSLQSESIPPLVAEESNQKSTVSLSGTPAVSQPSKNQTSGQQVPPFSVTKDTIASLTTAGQETDILLSDELGSLQGIDHARSTPHSTALPIGKVDMPQHVPRQLAEIVQTNSGKTVDVALSPEELGRVRLSITSADNGVVVSILAERPETLELLRRNVDQLDQELRQLGYQNTSFSFGNGNSDPNNNEPSANLGAPKTVDEEGQTSLQVPESQGLSTGPQAGLDLRI